MTYVNISGYQFIDLDSDNLTSIQNAMKTFCISQELTGTILLGQEGINSFLSGTREQIDAYYKALPTFGFTIVYKESPSECSPFDKMLVKIKREIVTLGHPDLRPQHETAPRLSPHEFHQWLTDKPKSFIILDTRNDYEVRLGKFKHSVELGIRRFREFPTAIEQLPEHYRDTPIVTVCTGGIRCEKAAPLMLRKGFKKIYQLEGGILKYLEEYGNHHYEGECFVFDKRMAVDENLRETSTVQCFICREPVTAQEQLSKDFCEGAYCPRCKPL